MSKKQSTLFQSWNNTTNKVSSSNPNEVVSLSDDDEDDLLLAMAMEESLRNIESEAQNSASASDQSKDNKKQSIAARESSLFNSFATKKTNVIPNMSHHLQRNANNSTNQQNAPVPGCSYQNQPGLDDDMALNLSFGLEDAVSSLTSTNATQIQDLPGFDKYAGKLWIYPTNYPVRDYQYNIVQQAIVKNTLVTLPTGLGKTFIAAVVMYNFYRWYPQGKIVFMAPTKPLVAQQIEACYNIMGIPQKDTAEMTGAMAPDKRASSWKQKRVFFLTPQVLINDLTRGLCPSDEVKCVVVDEAHKALGNHAYCQVVKELVKYSRDFRVLALSATPGSDIKSVQKVLENLLISHVELRTEDCIDIRPYVHERKVEKVVVKLDEDLKHIKGKYLQILEQVVHRLTRFNVIPSRSVESLSKFQILQARNQFRQDPPPNLQRFQMGAIEGDYAMCMSLYHGLELLQLHGLRSLYNYLDSLVNGEKGFGRTRSELMKNDVFDEIMSFLCQKYGKKDQPEVTNTQAKRDYQFSHPKLKKLQEVVLDHFSQFEKAGQQTRIMVFSQYRESVNEITEMLAMYQPMVKAMSFIGQSSAGKSSKGFTQKEQLQVMKQFRQGGYNTLVATCVGEEGLDIGDVDLIICFDASKSPIRLVQRMGRTGRKRSGRIVMLVTEGKEEQIYNQSQYSKKSIHKAIMNGAKSLHFYDQNPRMVPLGLTPKAHKMHITVKNTFKPANKVQGDEVVDGSPATKIGSVKKAKAVIEDGFLTPEELSYWDANFKVDERSIRVLPNSKFLYLKTGVQTPDKVQPSSKVRPLSLSDWTPWQNRLQKSYMSGHSMRSRHLVDTMEFMELQGAIGGEEDHYGMEMAMYLNTDDVSSNDPSILKYCSRNVPNENKNQENNVSETTNNPPERPSGCEPPNVSNGSKVNDSSKVSDRLKVSTASKVGEKSKRQMKRRSETLPKISDDERDSDFEVEFPDMEIICVDDDGDNDEISRNENEAKSVMMNVSEKVEAVCSVGDATKEQMQEYVVTDMKKNSKITKTKKKSKHAANSVQPVSPQISEKDEIFVASKSVLESFSKAKSKNDSLNLSQLFPDFQKPKSKRQSTRLSPVLSRSKLHIANIHMNSSDEEDSAVFEKTERGGVKKAVSHHVIKQAPSVDDIDDLDNLDNIFSDNKSPKLDTSDLLGLVRDWKQEKSEGICSSLNERNQKLENNLIERGEIVLDDDDSNDSPVFDKLTPENCDEVETAHSPVFEKSTQDSSVQLTQTKCNTETLDSAGFVPLRLDRGDWEIQESNDFCPLRQKSPASLALSTLRRNSEAATSTPVGKKRVSLFNPLSSPLNFETPSRLVQTPLPCGSGIKLGKNDHCQQQNGENLKEVKKLQEVVVNDDDFALSMNMSDFATPNKLSNSTQISFTQALAIVHQTPREKTQNVVKSNTSDLTVHSKPLSELEKSVGTSTERSSEMYHIPKQNSKNVESIKGVSPVQISVDSKSSSVGGILGHNDNGDKVPVEVEKPKFDLGFDIDFDDEDFFPMNSQNCENQHSTKNTDSSHLPTAVGEPKFDLGFDIDFDDDDFDDEIVPPSPKAGTQGTQPFVQSTISSQRNIIQNKNMEESRVRNSKSNIHSKDCGASSGAKSPVFSPAKPISVIPDTEAFPGNFDDNDFDNASRSFWENLSMSKPKKDMVGHSVQLSVIADASSDQVKKPCLSLKRKSLSFTDNKHSGEDINSVKPDQNDQVLEVPAFAVQDSDEEEIGVGWKKKKKPAIIESPVSQVGTTPVAANVSKAFDQFHSPFNTPIRPKIRKRNAIVSSDESKSDESFQKPKKSRWSLLPVTSDEPDDDDDFAGGSIVRSKELPKKNSGQRRFTNKKQVGHGFLEVEAELSGEDSGDDSDNSTHDHYDMSFINDCTQYQSQVNAVSPDMRAVYLHSVKSPQHGRYRLKYNHNTDINVFSQVPHEDDEDEYLEDSFCVDEDESEEMDHTNLDGTLALLQDQPLTVEKPKQKKRKRIVMLDSSPEDQLQKSTSKQTDSKKLCNVTNTNGSSPKNVHKTMASKFSDNAAKSFQSSQVPDSMTRTLKVSPKSESQSFAQSNQNSVGMKTKTPTGDLQKQERLRRQKEKQEEFRRMMSERQKSVGAGTISGGGDSMVMAKDTPSCDFISPMSDRIRNKGKLVVYVDSREINGAQNLVSTLRLSCNVNPVVCQLTGCDYIVSHRMGVERKLMSDFSNGSHRAKLAERLQQLSELFDRPCLILEKDRVKVDDKKMAPPSSSRTKYVDLTLSQLANTNIKVLYSDSQEDTAHLISNLANMESKKNMAITSHKVLTSNEESALKFYLSLPKITYVTAMNLVTNFGSVREFLNSSESDIAKRAVVSLDRGRLLYSQIRRRFDPLMVPSSKK